MLSEKCMNWVVKGYLKQEAKKNGLLWLNKRIRNGFKTLFAKKICACGHEKGTHKFNGVCTSKKCHCMKYTKKKRLYIFRCKIHLLPHEFYLENEHTLRHNCPDNCPNKNLWNDKKETPASIGESLGFFNRVKKELI